MGRTGTGHCISPMLKVAEQAGLCRVQAVLVEPSSQHFQTYARWREYLINQTRSKTPAVSKPCAPRATQQPCTTN